MASLKECDKKNNGLSENQQEQMSFDYQPVQALENRTQTLSLWSLENRTYTLQYRL